MGNKNIMSIYNFRSIILLTISLLAGCTAHYPINESITNINEEEGYRLGYGASNQDRSDELLVLMAFSGGGTRAAAFSYGVLEGLRDVTIQWDGRERRLLDEIDTISSVSGGSFTAAYYGLFGDRIFVDYEEKFLKKNVQGHLTSSVFMPWNWFEIGATNYGRSDYAAEYYDEILFEGKTYGDILERKNAPLIQINATEVSTGTQFTFLQNGFDILCSDLSSYPVSRAVAASSAVPVLFSSITVNNYAGSCDYEIPQHALHGLNDMRVNSRRRHLLEKYIQFTDSASMPYLHLYDGGLTDNLGIRPMINRMAINKNDIWKLAKDREYGNVRRVLFIVVNAQAETHKKYSRLPTPVPLLDAIFGATSIPLNEYTFESIVTLYHTAQQFKEGVIEGRCADDKYNNGTLEGCDDIETHIVYLDIDQLEDVEERDRLKLLPTSFVLKPEEVDGLRNAAKTVLENSREFNEFLNDLK
jgi:NTE family protein